jgi:hypothetical protein
VASAEEYHRVIAQQVLSHDPLPPATRAYYLAKGLVLASFLWPGMSAEEVRRVLGVRANGWAQEGERWMDPAWADGSVLRDRGRRGKAGRDGC